MKTDFFHLSDLHYRSKWDEQVGFVLDKFFDDLTEQIKGSDADYQYVIFSGDFVKKGEDPEQYTELQRLLGGKLDQIGLPKSQRIAVPGNHDVSQDVIRDNVEVFASLLAREFNETAFNNYVDRPKNAYADNFNPYLSFEKEFCSVGVADRKWGCGHELSCGIGVYCLTSPICSAGGAKDENGNQLDDKRKLHIDTRNAYKWAKECILPIKIMVSHHPAGWLSVESEKSLDALLKDHFQVFLSGHEHTQGFLDRRHELGNILCLSAPALFTKKEEELGYAILRVDTKTGPEEVRYRQWTQKGRFVPGVSFAANESGIVNVCGSFAGGLSTAGVSNDRDSVSALLKSDWERSLISYSGQPTIWVEPTLAVRPETAEDARDSARLEIDSFLKNPINIVVKAPPQFGLTCFGRYLSYEAWKSGNGFWLYLDGANLRSFKNSIIESRDRELNRLGLSEGAVKAVIVDSLEGETKHVRRTLKYIHEVFGETPLVVLERTSDLAVASPCMTGELEREFFCYYLWALAREQVRQVVTRYNNHREIGDEDLVLGKIVADIDGLNIHRTPLNCITLLKVSEYEFSDSPVNRTEVIKRVLFLAFNMEGVPGYDEKPDMKDCEYVLGYFSELLLRRKKFGFTKDEFYSNLTKFCKDRVLQVDLDQLFAILINNHIISLSDDTYIFKFSFYLSYFSAHRMFHSEEFRNYIFLSESYSNFPEIIEFYTGLDRARADAVSILTHGVRKANQAFESRFAFPDIPDPYRHYKWYPKEEDIEVMRLELDEALQIVEASEGAKDKAADSSYDLARPYDQRISSILEDYSLALMIQSMRGGARALRNSDYVDPELKRELLKELFRSWGNLIKTLILLSPLLANEKRAVYEGMAFHLSPGFSDEPIERFKQIMSEIHRNVVEWYHQDMQSKKMYPLLVEHIRKDNDWISHCVVLMLLKAKPKGWDDSIKKHVLSLDKNSFYLWAIYRALRSDYTHGFMTDSQVRKLAILIKTAGAKHVLGSKRVGPEVLKKISDDNIPEREVGRDT